MENEHERVAQWKDDFLPHVVDRLAHERPNAKFGEWVTGSSATVITYAQLANVINGLSWWLVEQLGPGRYDSEPDVLAYVGPNDVRYGALVLAAIKTGYVVSSSIALVFGSQSDNSVPSFSSRRRGIARPHIVPYLITSDVKHSSLRRQSHRQPTPFLMPSSHCAISLHRPSKSF